MIILSIDPGSTFTGVTISKLNNDGSIHILFVETIKADKLIKHYRDVEFIYGSRYARIIAICNQIKNLLELYQPDAVVCEQSFYNPSRPGAFAALVEVITMLRTTVFQYNPSISFDTIDPSTIKNAVNVSGTSGDKDKMKEALKKLSLSYECYLQPELFDEHMVDSVAINFCFCLLINKQ